MTIINNAHQLIAVCARNGVRITYLQAAIALRHIAAAKERVAVNDCYRIWLESDRDPGNGYEYDVADLFELAHEYAEDAYSDSCSTENTSEDDRLRLAEDEHILAEAIQSAREVIPVKIRTYHVNIIEWLKRTVAVKAASTEEAELAVRKAYAEGKYGELTREMDLSSVMFNVTGWPSDNADASEG